MMASKPMARRKIFVRAPGNATKLLIAKFSGFSMGPQIVEKLRWRSL